ncbi:hypothetical protein H0B56_09630 [Haloechinothrix sp. YIM 98757]|uniref:Uncharacterized protein n=1 Tax=Haloechinothrix aidingensis TaxID=2752311 RepID=A0A838A764_9PSEU|nr:hypothetical protein [Haloechinothrix aidingensis]MBA0125800.1 hypothetical protein [Haloechinothrix aidingensis]
MRLGRVAAVVLAGILAAGLTTTSDSAPEAGAAEVSTPLCGWPIAQTGMTPNVMAPHPDTGYWFLRYSAVPEGRLAIRGSYARARYFSFVVHDETVTALDGINDSRIAPDDGSVNPFLTRRPGDTDYTVYIDFGPEPPDPEPNTLYAGETLEGEPNPGGYLVYRVFLPHDRSDPAGGVPLPEVTLELPGGDAELTFDSCPPFPPTGAQRPLNELVAGASRPAAIAGVPPPTNRVTYPPEFEVIHNGQVLQAALSQVLPEPIYALLPERKGTTYGNTDVAYVVLLTHRQYGDLVVFRAHSPSHTDLRGGELATARKQVRLWNACTSGSPQEGGFYSLDCIDDEEAALTPRPPRGAVTPDAWETGAGATFVVSDPEHRPTEHMSDVNWLPRGPFAETMVFYRFMLPHPDFEQHPGNVDEGTDPEEVMGDYFPEATYCSTETFNEGGADACFAE